ncbi:hypothetical protein Pcinc_002178 [Petrolisthes cinctipes]|uniref:Carboxylic ester hydrolase n=1 Tax=Petrolisthes cinctipes TaxID=88211 RepID=A0AAE1GLI9_PETCI|nr:hypothetical protein Pcinc_002178 [Petrolisthes cinctipes]
MVAAASSQRVVVSTDDGKISGVKLKTIKGRDFYCFKSIPYAKAPVGDLRLRDPVAGKGWEGVRDGGVVAPMCPQTLKLQRIYLGDEDCLYLTVSTHKPGDIEARLPVLVFIHGGAHFFNGNEDFPPTIFMDYDVIYVGVQYRLGVLGFLSTEDSIIPGNFGLKDQLLALRWIQNNIGYFGGDPMKVTISGHSSGAICVHCLVLSPHSKGLFSKAIIQSGHVFIPSALAVSNRNLAHYTGMLFGCPHTQDMSSEEASLTLYNCLLKVDVQNVTLSLLDHYVSLSI